MKKIILILLFIVNALAGYSGSVYLLGKNNHSGIHIEVWRYDGTLVDTTSTNGYGYFTIRYADTYTDYKLIATKQGYSSIVVDSVRASGSAYSSADGLIRPIDFKYNDEPVLRPVNGLKILKGYIDENLMDTTGFYLVESKCRIAKDIKVGAGVKICFMKGTFFYTENRYKISFEGTQTDSVRFIAYPNYNGNVGSSIDLYKNASADFSFCSFNTIFNIQLKDNQTKAIIKNCKIQYLTLKVQGIAEIRDNTILSLAINKEDDFVYNDNNLPEIKIENNKINSLTSRIIDGPIIIQGNKFSGPLQIDTVLSKMRVEGNILQNCYLNYLSGLDLSCNKVQGSFTISSYTTEGKIVVSDNAFVNKSGDIIIQNDLAGIEIRNNYFSIKRGRLKIRPGDYQWVSTRAALFENNTVSGDVIFLNDSENITRNVAMFRNIFGGEVMAGEINLEHNDNLFKKDVWCFCNVAAEFTNTLGYKTDRFNNIFSESISFINDTLPFLKESSEGIERRLGVKIESSCLNEYYKNAMVFSDDHSISGKISSESPDFTLAYVAAINIKNGKTSIQKTNNDGTYSIKGLKKGEYILYAIPRDTGYLVNNKYVITTLQEDYFPTYFLNKLDLKLANKLILTGDITEANISLIKRMQSNNTNDVVMGSIFYKDTTSSDAGTDWMGSSIGDNPFFAPDTKHYACLNLILYAVDENGLIVDWAKTNSGGGFIFANLPAGKFKVKTQRFGYHLENEESFIVEPGMTRVIGYLVKDDVNPTTSIFPVINERTNNVSPNPFQERFILKDLTNDEEVTVYDMMGNLVLKQVIQDEEILSIDGSLWPAGIYIVKTGDKINKIIKE
ncbi:T9SS type A sorting domain-containing protein [Sporocytophaga myxococcoides]|uniref:T9SS type A sorting domain-containing protein n=1 Tax=Sporocytophaga myxococcoides TaxID=153721 RepID=UPI0003FFAE07|nr:T9SS type A sorting domain-containing protein [Sporocytophaga myxococcoides]